MKPCPFCAEPIQDAAIKCRFCNSMLDGSQPVGPSPSGPNAAMLPARAIYTGTPSWKAWYGRYLLSGLLGLAAVALTVVLAALFAVAAFIAVAAGAVLLLIALVNVTLTELRRRATTYRVNARTVDVEEGVLARRINTLQLWRVRDVVFEQSLVQRMLGVADVVLLVNDPTSPKVLLAGLTDGRRVFEEMKSAIDAARQSRNVVGVVE